MYFISLSIVIALAAGAAAEFICQNPTVVDQTTAGQNGEVAVKYLECANQDELRSVKDTIRIARRQTAPANVCGNTCVFMSLKETRICAESTRCRQHQLLHRRSWYRTEPERLPDHRGRAPIRQPKCRAALYSGSCRELTLLYAALCMCGAQCVLS
jgi:hypothetical protein